jgi:hypothetical protein
MPGTQLAYSLQLNGDWLVGPDNEHLMWIPIQNRDALSFHPLCRKVLSCHQVTVLDLSSFEHGSNWGKCYVSNL